MQPQRAACLRRRPPARSCEPRPHGLRLRSSASCAREMNAIVPSWRLSPDGISVVDQTGRILTCNEQFARIHGYEHSGEIIGRYAAEFMTPEAYARLFSEVAAAFAAGESVVRGIEVEAFKTRWRHGHDGIQRRPGAVAGCPDRRSLHLQYPGHHET